MFDLSSEEMCPARGSAVQDWQSVHVDCHRALCHQEGDSSSGAVPSICDCQACLLPGVTVPPARGDTWQGHARARARAVPAQHSWAHDTNTFCANKAVSAKPGQHQSTLKTCCNYAWCYRRWEIGVGITQTQFLI